jgi:hypothetical protein
MQPTGAAGATTTTEAAAITRGSSLSFIARSGASWPAARPSAIDPPSKERARDGVAAEDGRTDGRSFGCVLTKWSDTRFRKPMLYPLSYEGDGH